MSRGARFPGNLYSRLLRFHLSVPRCPTDPIELRLVLCHPMLGDCGTDSLRRGCPARRRGPVFHLHLREHAHRRGDTVRGRSRALVGLGSAWPARGRARPLIAATSWSWRPRHPRPLQHGLGSLLSLIESGDPGRGCRAHPRERRAADGPRGSDMPARSKPIPDTIASITSHTVVAHARPRRAWPSPNA